MHRVLIIDDEPWSREVVKNLTDWKHLQLDMIGEADDGTQGLKLMEECDPHIVVTDMRMPGLDGTGLLKEINERFPKLKIIVMSGYDDFHYLKQAIRSRAVDYLLKPVNPEELNASLMRCVRELSEVPTAVQTLTIPSVFEDSTVFERYMTYRKLIFGYLLDLNQADLLQVFEKLKAFLEHSLPNKPNTAVLSKISSDFMQMLEEFIFEHHFKLDVMMSEKTLDGSSVIETVDEIATLYQKTIDEIETQRKNKNKLDVTEVQAYIDRHFQDGISLDMIAQHFFVSKEYLSRTFKDVTGENISETIVRRRMEKAREWIVEHRMSIKNAAQLTGYTDLAYFYRVFKKHFGTTPGDMRDQKRHQ